MASLERFTTLAVRLRLTGFLRRPRHTLLTETNQLHLTALFGKHSMRLLGVWGALRFVVTSELLAPVFDSHWFFAQALSTRFGYGRPAFLARA